MGRPPIPEDEKKIRESIYLEPDIRKWAAEKAAKRSASLSSFLNVVLRIVMEKERDKKLIVSHLSDKNNQQD